MLSLVLALPLTLTACYGAGGEPDTAELDRFLLDYVDALNRRDTDRLSDLLSSNHDSRQIEDRVARFGGQGLRNVRITRQRESPDLYVVFLSARSLSGRAFEEREIAAWRRERWTLTPWPAQLKAPPARPPGPRS
jgi:hypothetical protein